ncbi:hypothetical protein ACWDBO_31235 [Streptomyces mirabilis]|uniref:hypothetical protein n=1 Tax=Streptomyces mirabilis TaxID=68239 RepID=UPI003318B4D4
MTTRPTPPHGTQGRYKGTASGSRPPCRCPKCVACASRAGQERTLDRLAGRPRRMDAAPVLEHLHKCLAAGMTQGLIARQAGVNQSTISRLLRRPNAQCQRSQGERILAVRVGDFSADGYRPSIGTMRRVRGLYAAGHGPRKVAAIMETAETRLIDIARGIYGHVTLKTDMAVREAVAVLRDQLGTDSVARDRAFREGWPPLGAWDDIDDPNAVPEWTGRCGTDRGYWMHRRQRLPMCPRCEKAHEEWIEEHADLDGVTLNQLQFAARAAATTREADLAHDARELMRVSGLSVEQAAERLEVTRPHLHQALKRHPAPAEPVVTTNEAVAA